MPTYPASDHYNGRRFFNPHGSARPVKDVITWMRTRQRTPWPQHVPLAKHAPPPAIVAPGEAAITFVG
ncbi:MAG: Zn-dependent hydrolase, partial [Vicinamibacterales bacterium]